MLKPAAFVLAVTLLATGVKFEQPIIVHPQQSGPQSGNFVAVPISRGVYQNSQEDLGDLRIYDKSGAEVPYILLSDDRDSGQRLTPTKSEGNSEEIGLGDGGQVTLVPHGVRREKERDVYDFEVTRPKGVEADVYLKGLEIWQETDASYLLEATVWGSYDGQSFERIQGATLYRVGSHTQGLVDFQGLNNYWYYRVTTNQPTSEPVALRGTGIGAAKDEEMISLVNEEFKLNLDLEQYQVPYTVKQVGSKTLVTVDQVDNLPIVRFSLKTESAFKRLVRLYALQGEAGEAGDGADLGAKRVLIYEGDLARLLLANLGPVSPTISIEPSLSRWVGAYKSLDLVIENEDDAPLKIDGVEVSYLREYIAYQQEDISETGYVLSYGDEDLDFPRYDIGKVEEFAAAKVVTVAELGAVKTIESEGALVKEDLEAANARKKLASNAAILGAAIVLGFLSFKALHNKGKE